MMMKITGVSSHLLLFHLILMQFRLHRGCHVYHVIHLWTFSESFSMMRCLTCLYSKLMCMLIKTICATGKIRHSGYVSVVNIAFFMIFAVFDLSPLIVCINCSFFYIYICCFITNFE